MKIYTKVIMDIDSGKIIESEVFEYTGPLAMCISLGGGGQKSRTKPEKVNIWTPEQMQLANQYWGNLYKAVKQPVPRYPGDMYVPTTAAEAAYFLNAPDYSKAVAPLSSLSSRFATDLGGLRANMAQTAFDINPEITEQYYQDVIRTPMTKEWQETVEPMVREAYAGPGYYSSARGDAQVKSAEDLATQLSSQRAQLYYADEIARRQALESAKAREAMYAPGTYGLESQLAGMGAEYGIRANELSEAAGLRRAEYSRQIEQERVLGELQRWLGGEAVNGITPTQYNPYSQLVMQALGISPYVVAANTVSSGSQFGFGIGPFTSK